MIKHIISDVGGVILEINFDNFLNEVSKLSKYSKEEINSKIINPPFYSFYSLFCRGFITKYEFYYEITKTCEAVMSYKEFEEMWFKIHVKVNEKFHEFLKTLSNLPTQAGNKYVFSILSDTDEIHWPLAEKLCADAFKIFDNYFLSHQMHLKKPAFETFFYMFDKLNASSAECLFIDDCKENIRAAKLLGTNTVLYNKENHEKCVEEIKSILYPHT